jgi:hypothetical protein
MSGSGSPLAELIGDLNGRPAHQAHVVLRKGVELTIPMWALTQQEEHDAKIRAHKYVKDYLAFTEVDLAWDEQQALADAVAAEVLAISLRNPKNVTLPFANDAQEIRTLLPSAVIGTLTTEYVKYQREQAWLQNVEDPVGELDKLVDLLGKGIPVSALLTRYDGDTLRSLLHSAVDRLASAASPTSSTSSP